MTEQAQDPLKNLLALAYVILGRGENPQPRKFTVAQQQTLMKLLLLADKLILERQRFCKDKNDFAKLFNDFFSERGVYSPDGEMITFFTKDWLDFCRTKWREYGHESETKDA